MGTLTGNLTRTRAFNKNSLSNNSSHQIEPAVLTQKPTTLLDRNEEDVISSFKRERSKFSTISFGEAKNPFKEEVIDCATNELTRKIILKRFTLDESVTADFVFKMNSDFDQLSKNEMTEISLQVKREKREWICFAYKKMIVRISPFGKIHSIKIEKNNMDEIANTIVKKGSIVFRIKEIKEI